MNTSQLLLIRHAETDLAGTFCGVSNPPINARGQQQIQMLLQTLQSQPIDFVYSSDLQRAVSTAESISSHFNAPMQIIAALREINFGEWESLTWEQIEQSDPTYARQWVEDYPNHPAPDGELFEDFKARVLCTFDRILSRDKNAAIVTHAGVLRVVMTHRYNLTEEQAWLQTGPYCSIFRCPTVKVSK
jgi:broad specificity phosphatase PhoE